MRIALVTLLWAICAGACAPRPAMSSRPPDASGSWTFELDGEFSIPPLTRFPNAAAPQFGGISGLTATRVSGEFLGISDDQAPGRFYRLRVSGTGANFRVAPIELVPLERPPDVTLPIDPEGIALNVATGQLFISSEGIGAESRVPPAILQFNTAGKFVRRLAVRDRFIPNPTGPLVKGVRSNIGFESLTITPDGRKLFSAVESAIVQDGALTTFERGAPARVMEYVARGNTYEPAREFVYMVEPIVKPPFEPAIAVNGLVELLALDSNTLLALERSFVAEAGEGRSMNRIRLFRITLRGATDVSGIESLTTGPAPVAVTKTSLLDLSNVRELGPELAPHLDNFEGIVFGPRLPDGRPTLIVVSDDNFNKTQRTWFLAFALNGTRQVQRIQ